MRRFHLARKRPSRSSLASSSIRSDTLRVNLAVFSTDYDDIQMTYRLGVVPLLFNAGVANIDGGELEMEYLPTEDFRLDMSLGYLDTKFDSITPPPPFGPVTPTATATLSSRLPFTPEWQGHLGMAYTFHPGSNWALIPRVDLSLHRQAVLRRRQLTGDRAERGGDPDQCLSDAGVRRRQVAHRARRQQSHRRVIPGGGHLIDDDGFRICRDHLCAPAHSESERYAKFLTVRFP